MIMSGFYTLLGFVVSKCPQLKEESNPKGEEAH
jgi:hypothetical protein